MKHDLLSKIYRDKEIQDITYKLMMMNEKRYDAITYLNIRYITTILIFIIGIYSFKFGYLVSPLISIMYYYLFYYITITKPLKKRTKKLEKEALQFFEILTLTLESGRNLENALETTVCNVESEISNEFKQTLIEMKFGKSLFEALEDMKKRIPSENINNIIVNITQTSIFGNSILDTMYNQLDFLRDKQILEIKGEINKIPNKVSIISVIFVVPLILLLVIGPFIIELIG